MIRVITMPDGHHGILSLFEANLAYQFKNDETVIAQVDKSDL
jgi:hypothetical protein